MIPHIAVDWTQVTIALLAIAALIAALAQLTASPHTGRHTREARLSSPEAVDATQPVPVRTPARELDRAGVI